MLNDVLPLGDDELRRRMDPLGPFEPTPTVAVGVSGGADSLALCLLADRWARAQGGRVVGLTVDHQLRPEAAAEAATVGQWLTARGIEHHILVWSGAKPSTGLQAAARQARYALLRGWCAEHAVLHLLLAHHQEDQAETFLLRLGRGSGVDGLAAMAPLTAAPELNVLRPLLEVPRDRMAASLVALDQPWIDDPSNRSDVFKRIRLRRMMPALAVEGLTAARLAVTAAQLGRARQALDQATAALLVRAVSLDPSGFARLDAALLPGAGEEISLRLVARLCRTVGGGRHAPRLERLQRLHAELVAGLPARRSFAGCVLAPTRHGVLVCREPAAVASDRAVRAGEKVSWDDRFTLWLSGTGEGVVAALGNDGWRALRHLMEGRPQSLLPRPVLPTIPAIVDRHGISAVPHLGYVRQMPPGPTVDRIAFTPVYPLAGLGHCLV